MCNWARVVTRTLLPNIVAYHVDAWGMRELERRIRCISKGGWMKALRIFVFMVVTVGLFGLSCMRAAAAPSSTIVVNSELDGATANDGKCTLREAILNANNDSQAGSTDCAKGAGADNIVFSIGGGGVQTINLANALPEIDHPLTIDGTTQPGCAEYPCIELNGSGTVLEYGLFFATGSDNSTVRGLVINQFGEAGIAIEGTSGNVIRGNFLGTDVTGTVARPNMVGITIFSGAVNNIIGGTTAAARNLISGNSEIGVEISDSGTDNNLIVGNYIGTDITGGSAVPNGTDGVSIENGAQSNTIGGTLPATRNIISGNSGNGVSLSDSGTDANVVVGNYIGTDVTGTASLGNGGSGISVTGGFNHQIGNLLSGARNIISGNRGDNVVVSGSNTSANIINNYIGTDVTGSFAINDGASDGIHVSGPAGAFIGNNLISGHEDGIVISGNSILNNIQGNMIGTTADGIHKIGNQGVGIKLNSSADNFIGGEGKNEGNVIAFSGDNGVQVSGNKNAILANSIFSNEGLGIELVSNGNNNQAAPVLTTAVNGDGTTIDGTLTSANNATYHLEFFSNAACDDSGSGEGQTFLGATDVTTNGSGTATVHFVATADVPTGQVITSTATDPNDNTSPFSNCATVQGPTTPPTPCATSPDATTLVSPATGSVEQVRAVPLDWADVNCATFYKLRVKQDSKTGRHAVVKQNHLLASQFTTPPLNPGHLFFWRVRACNTIGCGPWTEFSSFRVSRSATLR